MKTVFKNLWSYKNNILITWLFFFCITLIGKTPYNIFILFLISGIFSLIIILLYIFYVKSGLYQKILD